MVCTFTRCSLRHSWDLRLLALHDGLWSAVHHATPMNSGSVQQRACLCFSQGGGGGVVVFLWMPCGPHAALTASVMRAHHIPSDALMHHVTNDMTPLLPLRANKELLH